MPENDFNRIFAANLRRFLSEYGMTQADLAARLKVSPTTVSNWTKGEKSPRVDKIDAMCRIFNCRRSDFVEEESHQGYYFNGETAKVAQELFENPDLRMLFDAGRNATPEQLRMAAQMLRMFKEGNPDG